MGNNLRVMAPPLDLLPSTAPVRNLSKISFKLASRQSASHKNRGEILPDSYRLASLFNPASLTNHQIISLYG
jgi:hypothetical protein